MELMIRTDAPRITVKPLLPQSACTCLNSKRHCHSSCVIQDQLLRCTTDITWRIEACIPPFLHWQVVKPCLERNPSLSTHPAIQAHFILLSLLMNRTTMRMLAIILIRSQTILQYLSMFAPLRSAPS